MINFFREGLGIGGMHLERRAVFAAIALVVLAHVAVTSCIVAKSQPTATCNTASTPFCSAQVPLPPGWHGHVFQLSQRYPSVAPADSQPWTAYNPTTQPDQYLGAVLAYF